MSTKRTAGKIETMVGAAILIALMGIALGLFQRQYRFNAAVKAILSPAVDQITMKALKASALVAAPEGLRPLTPPEFFSPETLYEKIDGQAESYLAAGFVRLDCQRFAKDKDTSAWLEVFIYDMGSDANAFSVFSTQRRADAMDVDIGQAAYTTANALFMAHGRFYVQIVATSPDPGLLDGMRQIAIRFSRQHLLAKSEVAGQSWFPAQGMVAKSLAFITKDAFGFDQLNDVYTTDYNINGKAMTAFVARRANPQAARQLAIAFQAFFKEFDGIEQPLDIPIENIKLIAIMDFYEVIFTNGAFVAGVHEAEDKDHAVQLAGQLNRKLNEARREK